LPGVQLTAALPRCAVAQQVEKCCVVRELVTRKLHANDRHSVERAKGVVTMEPHTSRIPLMANGRSGPA
jgi:hypothetical protein